MPSRAAEVLRVIDRTMFAEEGIYQIYGNYGLRDHSRVQCWFDLRKRLRCRRRLTSVSRPNPLPAPARNRARLRTTLQEEAQSFSGTRRVGLRFVCTSPEDDSSRFVLSFSVLPAQVPAKSEVLPRVVRERRIRFFCPHAEPARIRKNPYLFLRISSCGPYAEWLIIGESLAELATLWSRLRGESTA